jgi:ATP-binding cassette subfamily B protein
MREQMNRPQNNAPMMGHRLGAGRNPFGAVEKPANAKGTMLRIVKIYLRWAKTILAAVLLAVMSAMVSVAIPFFLGKAFDTFSITTRYVDKKKLITCLTILFFLYLISWLFGFLNNYITLKVSQRLVFTLRNDFFQKLQKLPLRFFDTTAHGDTMSRITNDIDNISIVIAQTTTQLIAGFVTLVGSFAVMLSLNIYLTFVVCLSVPLVTILTRKIASKSRIYFKAQQRSLGELNAVIEENILGLKMVKAFNRQEDILHHFREINTQLCKSSTKAQVWSGFMMPLMNIINNLIFALVSLAGGLLSVSYGLSVGTVVSFLNYSKQFSQPLNSIAAMFNTIQSALAGAERVFEILDCEEETPDTPDATQMMRPTGEVTFRNVSFSYATDKTILKNISFHVNPGEVIALVGETGAGKTTIVNLLTRLYDADQGEILIDGIPITKVRRDSLCKCFSVVLQDTSLFTGTIMDNIRYSKTDSSDEEVVRAATIAHAHDFITKLPKGYSTVVTAATDNLSQGQRQLISIARAVLSDSPILILDEATSSVDTKTEKEIQRALVNLMKNRTSFLIAHRLSTIRDADCIMVIGDGRILEAGNHMELMKLKDRYYTMVMSQMGNNLAK